MKLSVTQKWISGGNSAPINKKAGNKVSYSSSYMFCKVIRSHEHRSQVVVTEVILCFVFMNNQFNWSGSVAR